VNSSLSSGTHRGILTLIQSLLFLCVVDYLKTSLKKKLNEICSQVKKRKLTESSATGTKEHDAHKVSKSTPTDGRDDDTAVSNLVVIDTEDKELVEYRFKVTP